MVSERSVGNHIVDGHNGVINVMLMRSCRALLMTGVPYIILNQEQIIDDNQREERWDGIYSNRDRESAGSIFPGR